MADYRKGWELLPGSHGCFVCDASGVNPRALGLKIYWNQADKSVHIPYSPDNAWCGYSSVVHGGLTAAVLDEAMAWAVRQVTGEWAFTVDFHLRYKKAVEPGQLYEAVAVVGVVGRKITAEARLMTETGQIVALAEAVFLPGRGLARPQRGEAE